MGEINQQQSEKAVISAEKQQKKVPGRPWPKGVSGNPKGKPPGTKSFNTIFEEAIREIVDSGKLPTIKDPEKEMMIKGIIEGLKGNFPFWKSINEWRYGQPTKNIDLTTGGESFKSTPEEREAINRVFKDE
jgi:transposase